MEAVKTNKEICEGIVSLIDYEQYEELGKDYYNLGICAKNDDCSKAIETTAKNFLTFKAMLELDSSMMLDSEFDKVYKPSIDFYVYNNDSDTPIYEQETLQETFYLGFFFNDLNKIYRVKEQNIKHKNCRSEVKLLKSNILYLACCDFYFNYFVGEYIAKLMLHLRVESKEEFDSTKKFIKSSINKRNHELLEFVLYRINHPNEAIIKSFDKKFGGQILDDAMSGVLVLDIIKDYLENAKDIDAAEKEGAKLVKAKEQKLAAIKSIFKGDKKSS